MPFIEQNLDSGAFKSDHWTFIHIPKTAGSSFREEVANVKQPDYNIEVDYSSLDPNKLDQDFNSLLRAAIERYDREFFDRTRFVSGHVQYGHLAALPNFQRSKMITMLRHPLARLKSDFLHRTSREHGNWEEACKRYPNFRAFIDDPHNQDTMWRFLCHSRSDTAEQTIEFLLERFTWIGLQEQYAFSIKMLFTLFGMRVDPKIVLRKSPEERQTQLVVSTEDQRLATEVNQKDFALFNFFADHYRKLAAQFYAVSDYDRVFKILAGLPIPA